MSTESTTAKSPIKKSAARRRKSYTQRISARFMSRQEFATLIAVHPETVKRREKTTEGWPHPVRIGKKIVLYDRAEVERFLQEAK